jgi:hypothetical protein
MAQDDESPASPSSSASPKALVIPASKGVLRIDRYFSYLNVADADGGEHEYLLLLHNSPNGALDTGTADFATSYLLHDLNKSDGSPLTVWGFEGTVDSRVVLSVIRAE